jgi:hypothetical protein
MHQHDSWKRYHTKTHPNSNFHLQVLVESVPALVLELLEPELALELLEPELALELLESAPVLGWLESAPVPD